MNRQKTRTKELDVYEPFVKMRLEACEDASAAQVRDWLKENYPDLPDVTERTVLNFVMQVRSKHGIPKPFGHRDYSKLDEPSYGRQAQVDFGEYNMTTLNCLSKKERFFNTTSALELNNDLDSVNIPKSYKYVYYLGSTYF